VHRLPQRAALDISLVERHTHSLYIGIRLEISARALGCVSHACGAADSAFHSFLVHIVVPYDLQGGIKEYVAEPVV